MVRLWESEDNLLESIPSFNCVASESWSDMMAVSALNCCVILLAQPSLFMSLDTVPVPTGWSSIPIAGAVKSDYATTAIPESPDPAAIVPAVSPVSSKSHFPGLGAEPASSGSSLCHPS